MGAGMVVTTLAVWPVAVGFSFSWLAIGLMLAGVMSGPIDVSLLTLRQQRTDARRLDRVMSISMSLNLAGFPLGSAIAGMVITTSLPAAFFLGRRRPCHTAIATVRHPLPRLLQCCSSVAGKARSFSSNCLRSHQNGHFAVSSALRSRFDPP